MQLSDKVYDVLKWICLIALPACGVFVTALFGTWGIPYAEPIAATLQAVSLFLGALLGISQISYSANKKLD